MYCVNSIFRDGETIHFLDIPALSESAPIVILLHGFPDNAFGWDLQIKSLKGKFHIIAPFLPGTLNDNLVCNKRITGEHLKKDLIEIVGLVRKTSLQKIFLISHDLGSFLSVSIAHELGSEINGLIHINGLGLDQFVSRSLSPTQWFRSSYVFIVQNSFVRKLINKVIPNFFLNLVYNLSQIDPKDHIRLNDGRVLNGIYIYKHLLRNAIGSFGKKIKKISTPSLFIWGKDDVFLNIPTINEVEKFYHFGAVRVLRGGHWVMRSKSDQVNRIIVKTLSAWEKSA